MEIKRKVIIHIITSDYSKKANFIADLDIMSNFSSENSVHNFYFYKDEKEPPILLNTYYAEIHNYTDEDKLEEKVKLLGQNNEIIYISTPFAVNIALVDRLRRAIGQVVPKNFDIFVDKSAQKELLAKDKSISVKYLKAKFDELDFGKTEKELGLPFILKPTSVASGLGVAKIKTKEQFVKYLDAFKELGTKIKGEGFSFTDELIAEEFID
jgi:formate-dependent phosphoribosylglycinamide formyltransferase (GAR transformylase)